MGGTTTAATRRLGKMVALSNEAVAGKSWGAVKVVVEVRMKGSLELALRLRWSLCLFGVTMS